MAASSREYRTYKKGEIIFRQGEPAECMYDIRWGSVGIYVDYGTENEKMLALRRGDEVFGEMSFVDQVPHSATAIAMDGETRLEIITRETFRFYLNERPERVVDIIQNMCRRIRDITRDYMEARSALAEALSSLGREAVEEK